MGVAGDGAFGGVELSEPHAAIAKPTDRATTAAPVNRHTLTF
jgi:hypothetical protein